MNKFLQVMDIFIIRIVRLGLQVYTYVKTEHSAYFENRQCIKYQLYLNKGYLLKKDYLIYMLLNVFHQRAPIK